MKSKRRIFPPSLVLESSTLAFHFSCCSFSCGGCCQSYVDHLIIKCMTAYSECQGLFQNQPCGKWHQRGREKEVDLLGRNTLEQGTIERSFYCFIPSKLLEATGFVPPHELPSAAPLFLRRASVGLHRGRCIYRL